MKIMLLAAAALSLGVGAAYADNEGNANTRYPQIIPEAAPTPLPEVTPGSRRPLFLLFRGRRAGSRTDS